MIFIFKKPKNAIELAKITRTPFRLHLWVFFNIHYEDDLKDDWQPIELTLKKRSGDCEDFAILYHDVLKRLGYKPSIICVDGSNRMGHATCIFVHKDINYRIGNWGYYRFKDMDSLCRHFFKKWCWWYEANVKGHRVSERHMRV